MLTSIKKSLFNAKTEKIYLVSPQDHPLFQNLSATEFKTAKEEALAQLAQDLAATGGNLKKIYEIFSQVKNATEGMLRYRREYILSNHYGETDSYGQAIDLILEAISLHTLGNKNRPAERQISLLDHKFTKFTDYAQFIEILQEAANCTATISYASLNKDIKSQLIKIKPEVVQLFFQKLKNKRTLDDVLDYYDMAKKPQSILKLHKKNVLHDYGITESYKKAIYEIALKVCVFTSYDQQKDRLRLEELYGELVKNKPRFNSADWDLAIDKLENFIKGQTHKYLSAQGLINQVGQVINKIH